VKWLVAIITLTVTFTAQADLEWAYQVLDESKKQIRKIKIKI